jgi:hypothetical protein
VLLGVGVTVATTCFVLCPPKVARKLAANLSTSSGATYTCVVSYCAPTPTWDADGCAASFATAADAPVSSDEIRSILIR